MKEVSEKIRSFSSEILRISPKKRRRAALVDVFYLVLQSDITRVETEGCDSFDEENKLNKRTNERKKKRREKNASPSSQETSDSNSFPDDHFFSLNESLNMALSDLVLDCKFNLVDAPVFILFLVYEITNASRVDMSDFELLKVLGTGGKSWKILFVFIGRFSGIFSLWKSFSRAKNNRCGFRKIIRNESFKESCNFTKSQNS